MNPDKLFKKYIREKMTGKPVDFARFEREVPRLYEEWLNTASDELGGKTPLEYFSTSTDADELLSAAFETLSAGEDPDRLLSERLSQLSSAKDPLTNALINGSAAERIYAASVLGESVFLPVEDFLDIALSRESAPELKDTVIEALKGRDEVQDAAFERFDSLETEEKKILAEILVTTSENDRILEILTDLLYSGEVAFASNLSVVYGDSRMVYAMQPLLETAGFVDYTELAHAILSLGGEIGEERDFSEDEDYLKIKSEGESSRQD